MLIRSHLAAMLLLTTVMVGVGAAQKAPCANRAWVEHRQSLPILCDSDIPNLLLWEQLQTRGLPYFDACATTEQGCDEYPPVTMYFMRATASLATLGGDPYSRFYAAWVLFLVACALATTFLLERMGARTVVFAAAPILLVAGMANLDLFPVMLTTAALAAFLARRDGWAGMLLGLGTSTKLFPGAALIPLAADRWRRPREDRGQRLVGATLGSWIVINAPFALLAFQGWLMFFRFNAARGPDFTSPWAVVCRWGPCPSIRGINIISAVLVVAGTGAIWSRTMRRHPGTPPWVMTFPILALILLTGKVWASHYALWILPWMAITSIPTLAIIEYQLAEVAVYLVAYHYFGTIISGEGISYEIVAILVVIRACLLLRCLYSWMQEPAPIVDVSSAPEPSNALPSGV